MQKVKMIQKQKEAIEYVEKFLANLKHEESTCCVFDGYDTEILQYGIEIYLRTWILPHMKFVLQELER